MKAVLAYLKARAGELSSVLAASGAVGVGVAYLSGQLTAKQALVAAAAAVVGYLYPEAKVSVADVANKVAPGAVKVLALFAVVGALVLGACSTAQLQTAQMGLQLACVTAQTNLAAAQSMLKGGANVTVASLAPYVNAGCPIVNGAVQVAANVAADPSSTAWVNGLSAGIQAAVTATTPPAKGAPKS